MDLVSVCEERWREGRWEETEVGGLIVGCSKCSGGQRDYVHVSAKKRYVISRLRLGYALVRNAV